MNVNTKTYSVQNLFRTHWYYFVTAVAGENDSRSCVTSTNDKTAGAVRQRPIVIFESHTPGLPFSPLIESIFYYRDFEPDHSIERLIPTGHATIVFELDGMERHTFDNDTLQPNASFRKAWLSGIHRHHISISAHQKSAMFVIQFKAIGALPFLHDRLDTFSERVIPGTEVLDGALLTLREKLLAATSAADKFAIADDWLGERYREDLLAPQSLMDIEEQLRLQPGAKYADVVEQYPNSQKHLIDQFKVYVGLTPKYYQRILRFNDIFRFVQTEQTTNWAAVAHHCGYTDQSHFIREFKHFSGFNPQEFVDQGFDPEVPNFFPLDRDG